MSLILTLKGKSNPIHSYSYLLFYYITMQDDKSVFYLRDRFLASRR
jgi:hypothetical protein